MEEVRARVERDVVGNVNFPMMHQCRAQVRVLPRQDGSHTFLFTDGVYSFSVRLDFGAKPKGHKPKKVVVI